MNTEDTEQDVVDLALGAVLAITAKALGSQGEIIHVLILRKLATTARRSAIAATSVFVNVQWIFN